MSTIRLDAETHRLQMDTLSWADYRNGGYGDHVAQCACGQYEYVSSTQEGLYWHWLHRNNPRHRSAALLRLLVDCPMPEGWVEPQVATATTVAASAPAPRRYTCPACTGSGVVLGGGGHGGRFYNYGSNESVACPTCSGSGHFEQFNEWWRAQSLAA